MAGNLIANVIIAVAFQVVAYLIAPKPKVPSTASQDIQLPQASAGMAIPKVWGSVIVKQVNVLWFGEKNIDEFEIITDGGGGKK